MLLSVDGKTVEVERKSLELLRYLLNHAGKLVTKDELLAAVWPGRIVSETVLTKSVHKLREALGESAQAAVSTVHGYGYRLDGLVEYEDVGEAGGALAKGPAASIEASSADDAEPNPAPRGESETPLPAGDRRLTAIAFTDIVGYSAIVHKDEALGAQLLDRQREVVRRIVPQHHGREVETAGDSFLLEFDSALNAVRAVLAIQTELANSNAREAAEDRVVLRASVHLGDVEHRGKEVYGDGVNTAARLMPHSPEGGMAISGQVLSMVKQRIQLPMRSIGTPKLKNIHSPVEIFVLDAPKAAAPTPVEASSTQLRSKYASPLVMAAAAGVVAIVAIVGGWKLLGSGQAPALDKSVAVLPFTNMSKDAENAYFADGMQDELLTAISKIGALKVISRSSTERYRDGQRNLPEIAKALGVATVLEGSVQRVGNRARINVQLIDASTDAHLWAESYDRELTDLFAVQSEVAKQVARALHANLLPIEAKVLDTAPTQNAKAYDLYLQAAALERRLDTNLNSKALRKQAVERYAQALQEDPDFALALAAKSRAISSAAWFEGDTSDQTSESARVLAERALKLQPDLGEAHLALGVHHYYSRRDYQAALAEFRIAQDTLPNNVNLMNFQAFIARREGRWNDALALLHQASSLDPLSGATWAILSATYNVLRDWPEAERALERWLAVAENMKPVDAELVRASEIYRHSGNLEPYRAAVEQLGPRSQAPPEYLWHYATIAWETRNHAELLNTLAAMPEESIQLLTAGSTALPKLLVVGDVLAAQGKTAAAHKAYASAVAILLPQLNARPDDPALHMGLGWGYAGLGRKAEAVAAGERGVELMPLSRDAYGAPTYLVALATIHRDVGNQDQAVALLRQILSIPGEFSGTELKFGPAWDPLREHPGFQSLIANPPPTNIGPPGPV